MRFESNFQDEYIGTLCAWLVIVVGAFGAVPIADFIEKSISV